MAPGYSQRLCAAMLAGMGFCTRSGLSAVPVMFLSFSIVVAKPAAGRYAIMRSGIRNIWPLLSVLLFEAEYVGRLGR